MNFTGTKCLKNFFFFLLFTFTQWSYCQDANLKTVSATLDNWHKAAATSDYRTYTSLMTPDAVFIGTDPTENWQGKDFLLFAKPYFDAGKAWTMKPLERHVFFDKSGNTAWFDELLETSMKICRGSGVLLKQENGSWKIAHYVLSITIPNENTKSVVSAKASFDDKIMDEFKKKQ